MASVFWLMAAELAPSFWSIPLRSAVSHQWQWAIPVVSLSLGALLAFLQTCLNGDLRLTARWRGTNSRSMKQPRAISRIRLSHYLIMVDTSGTDIAAGYQNGVLTLGGVDSEANYQQVLRTVRYENTSQDPYTTTRQVEFVVRIAEFDSVVASVWKCRTAPTITSLQLDKAVIYEGGSVQLTGQFTDPGVDDTHTVTVVWGDGTHDVIANITTGAFSLSHTYVANPYSGYEETSYQVLVSVVDDDGGEATAVDAAAGWKSTAQPFPSEMWLRRCTWMLPSRSYEVMCGRSTVLSLTLGQTAGR